jgi:twitching motility protein PilT
MKIDDILKVAVEYEASDLHIRAGNHPTLRIHGELKALKQYPVLTPDDTSLFLQEITTERQQLQLQTELDFDLGYTIKDWGRFRASIFFQRGSIAMAWRIIPLKVLTIRELLLPPVIEKITAERRGLVLVTGSTGSGKTTTLSAMVDHINRTRSANIITLEDPIECLHRDKKSTISQRDVGLDVLNFARGLNAALREDPDVIMVGSMRNQETIATVLLAAETGHLVLSCVHTLDAPEAINRIVSVFDPYQQRQIRYQLGTVLKAIISMRLIPKKDGDGRVPAVEVMINTPYISECLQHRKKTELIIDAIAAGTSQYGMQTFDQSIYYLYSKGYISHEQGLEYSTDPNNFKLKVMGVRRSIDHALDDMEKSLDRERPEATPLKKE